MPWYLIGCVGINVGKYVRCRTWLAARLKFWSCALLSCLKKERVVWYHPFGNIAGLIAHLRRYLLGNYFIRNHRQNRQPNFVKKVCGGVKKVNSIRSFVADEQVALSTRAFSPSIR